MLFNSLTFFIFFALVLVISRLVPSWRFRKFFLLVMSYLFYAAWNPLFLLLLGASTVVDWYIAKRLFVTTRPGGRKTLLFFSLATNFGLLGYFKYGSFLLSNWHQLASAIGLSVESIEMSIILPVGISFYTFQTLSYTFDVYRRRMEPRHSFLDYALYVTFFPQLVAGPIVRAADFLPQCEKPKKGTAKQLGWGVTLFAIGLFNKVVLADGFMAPVVDQVYSATQGAGFIDAWAGTIAFAIQIFCDFSGYSTCAIGVAMMIGFDLPDNFRFPYAAVGFSDFWRRWHISLSTWLRDYLYISLGGNRRGAIRTYVNLMATMLLGGLWHGASWMFVIWGGLHGGYLLIERLLLSLPIARWKVWRYRLSCYLLSLLTFALVCFTWVFFRAQDIDTAFSIVGAMVGIKGLLPESHSILTRSSLTIVGVISTMTLLFHHLLAKSSLEEFAAKFPWWFRSVVCAFLFLAVIMSLGGEDRAFIYFQF